jgi:hypothetical protein
MLLGSLEKLGVKTKIKGDSQKMSKEIKLNEKTQEKVKQLYSIMKQSEAQLVGLLETYLDAIGEKGKWQITEDLTKVIVQEAAVEDDTTQEGTE